MNLTQTNPPKIPIQLKLEDSTGIICSNCGGKYFKQSILIRRWSKLLLGSPQDHLDFIPAFRCDDCGEVVSDLLPEGLDSKDPTPNFESPSRIFKMEN